jgi:undecaprenyl-diphosphatase
VLGALLHGFIKSVLFSPWVVAVSLVLGGIAILLIEGFLGREDRGGVAEVENLSYGTALAIGFCQALAMIPGVSRAGATIMGALLLGVSRPTAVEFSFFLAIPTMLGATVFDLYKNRGTLDLSGGLLIAVGFVLAFLSALLVVRGFVGFITRHGFAPFGWYRIVVGLAMLAILLLR